MNEDHQKKQRILKYCIIFCIAAVFLIFAVFTLIDYFEKRDKRPNTYTTAPQLPLDGIDPKEIWVDQIRTENEVVHGKVDFMQDMCLAKMANTDLEALLSINQLSSSRMP
jgi:hypothetical protein